MDGTLLFWLFEGIFIEEYNLYNYYILLKDYGY